MINDIRLLVWAESKRVKSDAAYLMKILGIDPNTSWMYRVYVVLFWLFWLSVVWGYGVEQVYNISLSLSVQTVSTIMQFIPRVILSMQFLYMAALLREPPLKLTAPEMAYVVASPVRRGAVTLVQFCRKISVPAILIGLAAALLSMLLSWQSMPDVVGVIGLQILLLTFLLVFISGAAGWSIALLKQRPLTRIQRWAFWLVLPLLAIIAWVFPDVGLWAGQMWLDAVENSLSAAQVLALLVVAVVGLVAIYHAGRYVSMPIVADNSQMFARIQRLGVFGRFYAADVIASIHRQTRLARKRRLRLTMPANAMGYHALWSRATLAVLRLFPGNVLRALLRGMLLTSVIVGLVGISGWNSAAIWLLALIIVMARRPVELAEGFRDSMNVAFVRQFLPPNQLAVFAISAMYPILFVLVGSFAVLILSGLASVMVLLMTVFTVCALALAQAIDAVELKGFFSRRVPYPYAIGVYALLVFIPGVLLLNPLIALLMAALVNFVLATMLRSAV